MNRYGYISTYEIPPSPHSACNVSVYLGNGRGSGKTYFLSEMCKELEAKGRKVGVLLSDSGRSAAEYYRRIGKRVDVQYIRQVRHSNDVFVGRRLDDILIDNWPILYKPEDEANTFMHALFHRIWNSSDGRIVFAHDKQPQSTSLRKDSFHFEMVIDELPPHGGIR